jgi:hypothetical protein
MSDPVTTHYSFTKPTVGADGNTWGALLNTNFDLIDAAIFTMMPIAGGTFTGAVSGVTPAADDNTTLLSTTAWFNGQLSAVNPLINGTAAPGTSKRVARQDHVHPTDTTRAPTASPTFSGTMTVNGQAATPETAITFSATAMVITWSASNVQRLTMTANVTVAPGMGSYVDGQTLNIFITQDGTGSRTMTWPSAWKWVNGSVPVLSTAPGAVDLLTITFRATTASFYASLAKGFA